MTNPVLAALALQRMRAAPMFVRWCDLNQLGPLPAAPATVAKFFRDCASLGIERLWPTLCDISMAHASRGLADPTLGGAAAAAISEVAGIAPPRSWPADRKQRFAALPYDLQLYVAAHEAQREKALRRAQNEAAHARQKLATLQKSQTTTDEGVKADAGEGRAVDPNGAA